MARLLIYTPCYCRPIGSFSKPQVTTISLFKKVKNSRCKGRPPLFSNKPTNANFQTPLYSAMPMPGELGSSNFQGQIPAQSYTHGSGNFPSNTASHLRTPPQGLSNPSQHVVGDLFEENQPNRVGRNRNPSYLMLSPFTVQDSTTVAPRGRKKNTRKKSTFEGFNLNDSFDDDADVGDNALVLGARHSWVPIIYENVDPSKVQIGRYEDIMVFLTQPYPAYLHCFKMGAPVPVTFWEDLVPILCPKKTKRYSHDPPVGWLSGEHMNSCVEILIKTREMHANWTVAYTETVSVYPENNEFIILSDNQVQGTIDGTTRPFSSWVNVEWVYIPIHIRGSHWVTGAMNLRDSVFHVFDSSASRTNQLCVTQLIHRWTPILKGVLETRCMFDPTGGPLKFSITYNQGFNFIVPQQVNELDCGVITCLLLNCLTKRRPPIIATNPQEFYNNLRVIMCNEFYACRCENTTNCGHD